MMFSTLTSELAAVRAELTRVDAKCGTLTALTGAGMLALATQVTHGPAPVRALLGIAGVLLAFATVKLLSVLRPRLGSTGFRRYAAMTRDQVEQFLARVDPAEVEVEDLQVLSSIVNRKYVGLRHAVDLILFAVVLVAVALLVGVIA